MLRLTRKQLSRYDGNNGAPAYVACDGRVYDVTHSFLWQKGRHQALHPAGIDLTGEFGSAPHGTELLKRFPVVGELVEEQ